MEKETLFPPNKMPSQVELGFLALKKFPMFDWSFASMKMDAEGCLFTFPNEAWMYVSAATGEITFSAKGPELKEKYRHIVRSKRKLIF